MRPTLEIRVRHLEVILEVLLKNFKLMADDPKSKQTFEEMIKSIGGEGGKK